MQAFSFYMPTKLHFGVGQLEKAGEVAARYGDKVLVVTGKTAMKKTGILDELLRILKNAGLDVEHYGEVEPNPTTTAVDKGAEVARSRGCQVVIGLGGGSSIDAAKAIAVMARTQGSIYQFFPSENGPDAISDALPIIAIPTTAGTGTEANPFAVITNLETKLKPGIGNPVMYPKESIIDPQLMISVPKSATAVTGIDVLFHAMESYVSKRSQPLSDMIAEEAIRLVAGNLRKAYSDGQDLEARSKMAWASTLAGIAINTAGTAMLHSLAHQVGGHLNAVHGESLAALSRAFIEFTVSAEPEKFGRIATLLGADVKGNTVDDVRKACLDALTSLLNDVGLNLRLSDLGVKREMLETMAADVFRTMKGGLSNNPRPVSHQDIIEVYEKSL